MMKKPPPPKLSKAELMSAAEVLLKAGFNHPAEAVTFLLNQFTGWDLEALILSLRIHNDVKRLKENK